MGNGNRHTCISGGGGDTIESGSQPEFGPGPVSLSLLLHLLVGHEGWSVSFSKDGILAPRERAVFTSSGETSDVKASATATDSSNWWSGPGSGLVPEPEAELEAADARGPRGQADLLPRFGVGGARAWVVTAPSNW
ncbi:hypothetical protein TsFJ059_003825 [Trichoderma semiorbis]|uniref:Uncharacterized protein n=1 Tax=Trichoderma semiorbis TaxID=1491008 RepID=A0A9P8HJT1_9HYPO|nr:hypothetical protein TsFJ059_003825 [Trichoderma semiorbis]